MSIRLMDLLNEGVYDRGILKCVFMGGGPGSGKSYIIDQIFGLPKRSTLSGMGLKVVNSDHAFTAFLEKNGIDPTQLGKIRDQNPGFYFSTIDTGEGKSGTGLRQKAMRVTSDIRKFYALGRLGMIVDGTGAFPDYIGERKKEADDWGYDTCMVFVDTSLDVAQARNKARGEAGDRALSEAIVEEMWHQCQDALNRYRPMFGNNLFVINNSETRLIQSGIDRAVRRFINAPVKNPVGKRWIEQALEMKKSNIK